MKFNIKQIPKINRYFAWALFALVGIFIVSGFSMTGMFFMQHIISKPVAFWIHFNLWWVMIPLMFFHAGICLYLRFR